VHDDPASNIDFFNREIHVYLQFRLVGLFGQKRASLHVETQKLQEVFLSKPKLILTSKLLTASSNIDGFLWRDTCVFQVRWMGLFVANRAYFHFGNYDLQEVFLTKTNSFLTGKQCFICSSSNTDCFLCTDIYVSSTQLSRPIWNKMSISPPWKLWFSGSIPFKTNSVLTGQQCSICSCF
jgi:hypothetical protein